MPRIYADFMVYCLGYVTLHDMIVLLLNICSMHSVRNDQNKTVLTVNHIGLSQQATRLAIAFGDATRKIHHTGRVKHGIRNCRWLANQT